MSESGESGISNELFRVTNTRVETLDQQLVQTKRDVEQCLRNDLKLESQIQLMNEKQDRLLNRVDNGVAKTGQKTWEKVNEISISIRDLQHENNTRDEKIRIAEKRADEAHQLANGAVSGANDVHKRMDRLFFIISSLVFLTIVGQVILRFWPMK